MNIGLAIRYIHEQMFKTSNTEILLEKSLLGLGIHVMGISLTV